MTDGPAVLRDWSPADGPWYVGQPADLDIQRFTSEQPTTTADDFRAALARLGAREDHAGFAIMEAAAGRSYSLCHSSPCFLAYLRCLRGESANWSYMSWAVRSVWRVTDRVLTPTKLANPQIAKIAAAKKRVVSHHGIWITTIPSGLDNHCPTPQGRLKLRRIALRTNPRARAARGGRGGD